MSGMPDDAGQTQFFEEYAAHINTLPQEYMAKLGDGGERQRLSHWIDTERWFSEDIGRRHVLEHWLNIPTAEGKHQGWWRLSDPDDTVDRIATEAAWQTLHLKYHDFDGKPRDTALDADAIWVCAGHTFKVTIWVTEPKLIALYMTPPSPDKLDMYMDYRRHVRSPRPADEGREEYRTRFGRETRKRRPSATWGERDPIVIVADVSQTPDPHDLKTDDLTSGTVNDVVSFRPYRRADEMTRPWVYP